MIAILMSTYNGERFLREQLDSILSQTYTAWQLYVRDDGSTDATVSILREYATAHPERVIIDLSEGKPLGACGSFMHLLAQHGDADYFAFADQDDVWLPNKLEVSLAAMEQAEREHPNIPIVVHSDLQVVDEQLQPMHPSFWRYSNIRPDLVDQNRYYLAISNTVTGCAMLMNRAARAASLPFPSSAYMHDAWIALQTLLSGGIVCPIGEATILYRQHGTNVLGAVHYSLFGRTIRSHIEDARLCYRMGHPMVYKNKAHFLLWKVTYWCHRFFTSAKS